MNVQKWAVALPYLQYSQLVKQSFPLVASPFVQNETPPIVTATSSSKDGDLSGHHNIS